MKRAVAAIGSTSKPAVVFLYIGQYKNFLSILFSTPSLYLDAFALDLWFMVASMYLRCVLSQNLLVSGCQARLKQAIPGE
jgi:hypothetical protein